MNSRIFDQHRIWSLDRQTLEMAIPLLGALVHKQWTPDIVIGVARGGVEPARLLSEYLNLPVYYIRAKHNSSDFIRSAPLSRVHVNMTDVKDVPAEKRILLVDDICGTGKTLSTVSKYLRDLRDVEVIHTATMCCNAGSQILPDLSIWTVRDWVVFPWEGMPKGIHVESLRLPIVAHAGERLIHADGQSLQAV